MSRIPVNVRVPRPIQCTGNQADTLGMKLTHWESSGCSYNHRMACTCPARGAFDVIFGFFFAFAAPGTRWTSRNTQPIRHVAVTRAQTALTAEELLWGKLVQTCIESHQQAIFIQFYKGNDPGTLKCVGFTNVLEHVIISILRSPTSAVTRDVTQRQDQ